MAKRQKDKMTANSKLNSTQNTNPTKICRRHQLLGKGERFLLKKWHPPCYCRVR